MCRTDLGECVVVGCEQRATCQDLNGYCYDHDPFPGLCDCEGEECLCTVTPAPEVDVIKRLRYDIGRLQNWIKQTEGRIAVDTKQLALRYQNLNVMCKRLADLEAARERSYP